MKRVVFILLSLFVCHAMANDNHQIETSKFDISDYTAKDTNADKDGYTVVRDSDGNIYFGYTDEKGSGILNDQNVNSFTMR